MRVFDTFSDAWLSEARLVRHTGAISSPRGMQTSEKLCEHVGVSNPATFPLRVKGRTFANVVAILEGLSLIGQFNIPEMFTRRITRFQEFTDAGVFHGSYGARVHGRLGDLVSLLERDPDSRQAVVSIYDSRSDLGAGKRDIPCTISLQFFIRREKLHARVNMRSNDVWLGTPYDFQQFAMLQLSLAQAFHLDPGMYVHEVGSLHLYERDYGAVDILEEVVPSEPMPLPLWRVDTDVTHPVDNFARISRRARELSLGEIIPATDFERWACDLLH